MKKSIRFVTVVALLLSGTALKTLAREELKGRDIVAKGTVQSLSGTLEEEGHEWVLITSNGNYELHLGPSGYRESKGFRMTAGEKAEINGFVYEKHVSPISIKTAGSFIELRTEDGKPAWGGSRFSKRKSKAKE